MAAAVVDGIPTIDVGPLLDGAGAARDRADAALFSAASNAGFAIITGLPEGLEPTAARRADLKRIFSLDAAVTAGLWRRKFAPTHPNVYRGWFPAQPGAATFKEGIDMGGDLIRPRVRIDPNDPLTEPTPLPPEAALPGWHAAARAYYIGMERLAGRLAASLARSLGMPETVFAPLFEGGLSTLRLIRYPPRSLDSLQGAPTDDTFVVHGGLPRHTVGIAHVDTGCMTLLAQDGVDGLQARARDGRWLDVPPIDGTLVLNFGALLERWTGGRIRATEHRVLGVERERVSIPFFYEPRVDAEIAPLPLVGGPRFEAFPFGDYLWAAVTRFVEFHGLEAMRTPTRLSVEVARRVFERAPTP